MHMFLSQKPNPQTQLLEAINSNLDMLLISYINKQWDHNNFYHYKNCTDDNAKMEYRLKFEKARGLLRREVQIGRLVGEALERERNLGEAVGRAEGLERGLERGGSGLDVVGVFKKIGEVTRLREKEEFTNTGIGQQLQRIAIECNRTALKYKILLRAISSFRLEQNRLFTDYIGEKHLAEFQNIEVTQLLHFNENMKKKKMFDGLKNAVGFNTLNKEVQLIEETVKKLQNISSLSQLQKVFYTQKIETAHQSIFLKFVTNTKQHKKLQLIIDSLKNGMINDIQNLKNTLSEIDCDVELSKRLKLNLLEIGNKVLEAAQVRRLFVGMGLKMDFETVRQLFEYLVRVTKLLSLEIEDIERKFYNRPYSSQTYESEIASQNKPNIFNLLPYFLKLIQMVKTPPSSESYIPGQNSSIRQVIHEKDQIARNLQQELKKKNEEIQVLKWRVFNLNAKISRYENSSEGYDASQVGGSMPRMVIEEGEQGGEEREVEGRGTIEMVEINGNGESNIFKVDVGESEAQDKQKQATVIKKQLLSIETQTDQPPTSPETTQTQPTTQTTQQTQQTQQTQTETEPETQSLQTLKQKFQETEHIISKLKEDNQKNEICIQEMRERERGLVEERDRLVGLLGEKERMYGEICGKGEFMAKEIEMYREKLNQKEKEKVTNSQLTSSEIALYSTFNNRIFPSPNHPSLSHKKFLLTSLLALTKCPISSTNLIYSLDEKNKTDAHAYIDGIANWVALFELCSGTIIGAFCCDPIEQGRKARAGFIFNLNLQKVYKLMGKNQKAKMYQYDQYFLTIGNSEIRYRLGSRDIQTCFGSNFKYFDTGKDTAAAFFGQLKEKYQVRMFQFYEVVFSIENEKNEE